MTESNHGLIPTLHKILDPVNTQFKKDLKGYKISELYGIFLCLIFMISFAIGTLISYSNGANNNIFNLGVNILLYGVLSGIPVVFLFAYVFIHVYTACFKTTDTLKVTLVWQILALAISLILTFITSSASYIYGGLIIFFVLLFVYPFVAFLTTKPAESANIKQTLHKIYLGITFLIIIIQLVIKFAHL